MKLSSGTKATSVSWRVVALAVVIVLGFSGGVFSYMRELHSVSVQRSQQGLAELAHNVGMSAQRRLADEAENLQALALLLLPERRIDTFEVSQRLRRYNSELGSRHLVITMPDGRCLGDDVRLCEALEMDDHRFALSGSPSIEGPYVSSSTDRPVLVLSVPVLRNGVLTGTIHSAETLESYESMLRAIAYGDGVVLYVVRQGGNILASTAGRSHRNFLDSALENDAKTYDQLFTAVYKTPPGAGISLTGNLNGQRCYIVSGNLFNIASIVASVPVTGEVFSLARMTRYTFGMLGMFYLLLAFAGWYVWRFRTRMMRKVERAEIQLRSVIETIPGGVILTDDDRECTIRYMSEGLLTLLGIEGAQDESLTGRSLVRLMHEDDAEDALASMQAQLLNGHVFEIEYRLARTGGAWVWVLQKGRRMIEDGVPVVYSSVVDISEPRQLIEQSLISAESLRMLLDISGNSLFELDLAAGTIVFSQQFSDEFGWPTVLENFPQSVLGAALVYEDDVPVFLAFVDRLYDGEMSSEAEVRMRDALGRYRWTSLVSAVVLDKNHEAVKVVGKIEDIDAKKRSIAALQEKSRRDTFTGLYNKLASAELISEALYRAEPESRGALFIVDVDNFKTLNDTLGHPMGDQALKDVSEALRGLFRSGDIVGRLGGDEFIVFMNNVREFTKCYEKADAICESFRRTYESGGQSVGITASVGVALFAGTDTDYTSLYKQADSALYHAKRNGKNRFCVLHE